MPFDPVRIANSARAFFMAADRAMEARPLRTGKLEVLLIPAVVSWGFGIELAFKAAINLDNRTAGGHDLFALFRQLPPSAQEQIRRGVQPGAADFDAKLAEVRKVFEQFRYVYESESVQLDLGFLRALARESRQLLDAIPATRAS